MLHNSIHHKQQWLFLKANNCISIKFLVINFLIIYQCTYLLNIQRYSKIFNLKKN